MFRDHLENFFLIFIAIISFLLAAEGISRIFFDPTDYLWRRLKYDDILRYRVEPNTRGHDSWGFRNKTVPTQADIVAIGDSQTYGTSTLAKYSWPSVLGKLTGSEVYNMSLGGYGPAEYLYLMKQKALGLHPNLIIAGFSLGNDLTDSYAAVYNVPVWEDLRNPEIASVLEQQRADTEKHSRGSRPRTSIMTQINLIADWFSGHSVLYRVITTSSFGDFIRQKRMIWMGEDVEMFEDSEHGIYTGFTPEKWLEGLDLKKTEVREGLRLTLELFNRMNAMAEKNNIRFLVVLIPTKESVYGDFIVGNDNLASSCQIDRLIENERQVKSMVKSYFRKHGIAYLDVLRPLKNAAGSEQIYPNNYSGHPNKNGNEVIADSIKLYLDTRQQN